MDEGQLLRLNNNNERNRERIHDKLFASKIISKTHRTNRRYRIHDPNRFTEQQDAEIAAMLQNVQVPPEEQDAEIADVIQNEQLNPPVLQIPQNVQVIVPGQDAANGIQIPQNFQEWFVDQPLIVPPVLQVPPNVQVINPEQDAPNGQLNPPNLQDLFAHQPLVPPQLPYEHDDIRCDAIKIISLKFSSDIDLSILNCLVIEIMGMEIWNIPMCLLLSLSEIKKSEDYIVVNLHKSLFSHIPNFNLNLDSLKYAEVRVNVESTENIEFDIYYQCYYYGEKLLS